MSCARQVCAGGLFTICATRRRHCHARARERRLLADWRCSLVNKQPHTLDEQGGAPSARDIAAKSLARLGALAIPNGERNSFEGHHTSTGVLHARQRYPITVCASSCDVAPESKTTTSCISLSSSAWHPQGHVTANTASCSLGETSSSVSTAITLGGSGLSVSTASTNFGIMGAGSGLANSAS